MQENKELSLLRKEVLETLSRRDLGIKDAFAQIDKKIQQAFGMVEMKFEIIMRCLLALGITQDRIAEITALLEDEINSANSKRTEEAPENDPYNPNRATVSVEQPAAQREADTGKSEQGTEFFI